MVLVATAAPFHSSVLLSAPGGAYPPKAKPAVCVPQPPKPLLAVASPVGLEVQVVPFHVSVIPVLVLGPGVKTPPAATAKD